MKKLIVPAILAAIFFISLALSAAADCNVCVREPDQNVKTKEKFCYFTGAGGAYSDMGDCWGACETSGAGPDSTCNTDGEDKTCNSRAYGGFCPMWCMRGCYESYDYYAPMI